MKNKFGLLSSFLIILALLLTAPHLTVSAVSGPNLQIINLSGATFNFTYDQLLAMPKTTVTSDLFCDGSLVTTGEWGGISLNYLLTQAQISSNVMSIDFIATDNYHVSIPISLAVQPQIIIAYDKNNQTLNEGLRLILPGINGPTWIASISSIGMSTVQVADPSAAGAASGGIPPVIPYPSDVANESTTQQQASQPTPPIQQIQPSPTATTSPAGASNPYQAKSAVQPSSPQNQGLSIVLLTAFALLVVSFAIVYITARRRRSASVANSDLGS
jgi:DMSO/TMAO reductase YedYZ molybdopterin-dependent catalytic subunit